jgi:hypothetical protein
MTYNYRLHTLGALECIIQYHEKIEIQVELLCVIWSLSKTRLCTVWVMYTIDILVHYSSPSVYEQSVYEFSLIRVAQINTCFSIY